MVEEGRGCAAGTVPHWQWTKSRGPLSAEILDLDWTFFRCADPRHSDRWRSGLPRTGRASVNGSGQPFALSL